MVSTLSKFNTDLQQHCCRYLCIATSYAPTPLPSLVSTPIGAGPPLTFQPCTFLDAAHESNPFALSLATYSNAHNGREGKTGQPKPPTRPRFWWIITLVKLLWVYLHVQTTFLLAVWQAKAYRCWDVLLLGAGRRRRGPRALEAFPGCAVYSCVSTGTL